MEQTNRDTLLAIRGARDSIDPNYACMAHDGTKNRYLLLGLRDGKVITRDIYDGARKEDVEHILSKAVFRGIDVRVDARTTPNLLRLKAPVGAGTMEDMSMFRRSKSNEEIQALGSLFERTFQRLHVNKDETAHTFRGSGSSSKLKGVFLKNEARGFTQYRAGFRDARGRVSDLTRVIPKNEQWKERLQRVYRGLHAVREGIRAGVTVDDLNKTFRGHLDPMVDRVHENDDVVRHIGFETTEVFGDRVLREDDFVKIGCSISDGKEVALVYTFGVPVASAKSYRGAGGGGADADAWRVLKDGLAMIPNAKRNERLGRLNLSAPKLKDQLERILLQDSTVSTGVFRSASSHPAVEHTYRSRRKGPSGVPSPLVPEMPRPSQGMSRRRGASVSRRPAQEPVVVQSPNWSADAVLPKEKSLVTRPEAQSTRREARARPTRLPIVNETYARQISARSRLKYMDEVLFKAGQTNDRFIFQTVDLQENPDFLKDASKQIFLRQDEVDFLGEEDRRIVLFNAFRMVRDGKLEKDITFKNDADTARLILHRYTGGADDIPQIVANDTIAFDLFADPNWDQRENQVVVTFGTKNDDIKTKAISPTKLLQFLDEHNLSPEVNDGFKFHVADMIVGIATDLMGRGTDLKIATEATDGTEPKFVVYNITSDAEPVLSLIHVDSGILIDHSLTSFKKTFQGYIMGVEDATTVLANKNRLPKKPDDTPVRLNELSEDLNDSMKLVQFVIGSKTYLATSVDARVPGFLYTVTTINERGDTVQLIFPQHPAREIRMTSADGNKEAEITRRRLNVQTLDMFVDDLAKPENTILYNGTHFVDLVGNPVNTFGKTLNNEWKRICTSSMLSKEFQFNAKTWKIQVPAMICSLHNAALVDGSFEFGVMEYEYTFGREKLIDWVYLDQYDAATGKWKHFRLGDRDATTFDVKELDEEIHGADGKAKEMYGSLKGAKTVEDFQKVNALLRKIGTGTTRTMMIIDNGGTLDKVFIYVERDGEEWTVNSNRGEDKIHHRNFVHDVLSSFPTLARVATWEENDVERVVHHLAALDTVVINTATQCPIGIVVDRAFISFTTRNAGPMTGDIEILKTSSGRANKTILLARMAKAVMDGHMLKVVVNGYVNYILRVELRDETLHFEMGDGTTKTFADLLGTVGTYSPIDDDLRNNVRELRNTPLYRTYKASSERVYAYSYAWNVSEKKVVYAFNVSPRMAKEELPGTFDSWTMSSAPILPHDFMMNELKDAKYIIADDTWYRFQGQIDERKVNATVVSDGTGTSRALEFMSVDADGNVTWNVQSLFFNGIFQKIELNDMQEHYIFYKTGNNTLYVKLADNTYYSAGVGGEGRVKKSAPEEFPGDVDGDFLCVGRIGTAPEGIAIMKGWEAEDAETLASFAAKHLTNAMEQYYWYYVKLHTDNTTYASRRIVDKQRNYWVFDEGDKYVGANDLIVQSLIPDPLDLYSTAPSLQIHRPTLITLVDGTTYNVVNYTRNNGEGTYRDGSGALQDFIANWHPLGSSCTEVTMTEVRKEVAALSQPKEYVLRKHKGDPEFKIFKGGESYDEASGTFVTFDLTDYIAAEPTNDKTACRLLTSTRLVGILESGEPAVCFGSGRNDGRGAVRAFSGKVKPIPVQQIMRNLRDGTYTPSTIAEVYAIAREKLGGPLTPARKPFFDAIGKELVAYATAHNVEIPRSLLSVLSATGEFTEVHELNNWPFGTESIAFGNQVVPVSTSPEKVSTKVTYGAGSYMAGSTRILVVRKVVKVEKTSSYRATAPQHQYFTFNPATLEVVHSPPGQVARAEIFNIPFAGANLVVLRNLETERHVSYDSKIGQIQPGNDWSKMPVINALGTKDTVSVLDVDLSNSADYIAERQNLESFHIVIDHEGRRKLSTSVSVDAAGNVTAEVMNTDGTKANVTFGAYGTLEKVVQKTNLVPFLQSLDKDKITLSAAKLGDAENFVVAGLVNLTKTGVKNVTVKFDAGEFVDSSVAYVMPATEMPEHIFAGALSPFNGDDHDVKKMLKEVGKFLSWIPFDGVYDPSHEDFLNKVAQALNVYSFDEEESKKVVTYYDNLTSASARNPDFEREMIQSKFVYPDTKVTDALTNNMRNVLHSFMTHPEKFDTKRYVLLTFKRLLSKVIELRRVLQLRENAVELRAFEACRKQKIRVWQEALPKEVLILALLDGEVGVCLLQETKNEPPPSTATNKTLYHYTDSTVYVLKAIPSEGVLFSHYKIVKKVPLGGSTADDKMDDVLDDLHESELLSPFPFKLTLHDDRLTVKTSKDGLRFLTAPAKKRLLERDNYPMDIHDLVAEIPVSEAASDDYVFRGSDTNSVSARYHNRSDDSCIIS